MTVSRTNSRRVGIAIAILLLAGLYVGGYLAARSRHYLVHYSGSAYGNTANHRIGAGDLGTGLNPAYQVAGVCDIIFTPLRWIETGYWYVRYPTDQPWPYGAGSASSGP